MPIPVVILTTARATALRKIIPARFVGLDPTQLASGEWFLTIEALRAAGIEDHPRFDLIRSALAGSVRLVSAKEFAGFAEMDADAIAAIDAAQVGKADTRGTA